MGLLSKLRSLLGGGDESPPRRGDVDVTVEREPSTVAQEEGGAADAESAEARMAETDAPSAVDREAVEGEPAAESEPAAEGEPAAEPEPAAESGPAAEPVERIKGIGPSYAGRLGRVDVETVGELADHDAESLSAATDISEKRLERWIERARARIR